MEFAILSNEIYNSLVAIMVLSGPFLVAAIGLGLALGLIQAVTQIQDQTVPQLVKIIALFMMVIGFSSYLALPLYDQTLHLFTMFPYLVR